jgi:hypothetical protein
VTPGDCRDALVGGRLPDGFVRWVLRVGPRREVGMDATRLADAIVVVDGGALEITCRAGTCRRFERGAMIPIGRLPGARLRSAGPGPLVLVAVARRPSGPATDEFRRGAGSHRHS